MSPPESWAALRAKAANRPVSTTTIKWDGEAKSAVIEVPVIGGHCMLAIENGSDEALAATFEHRVYYKELNAAASLGTGVDGTVAVTIDEPGPGGMEYSIAVALGEYVDEALPLTAALDPETKKITVQLATDAGGGIDAENIASLVAAAIDLIPGISAEASGEGTDVVAPTETDVPFEGGYEESTVDVYGLDNNPLSLAIAADTCRAFEPLMYFPRFLGGMITLTAAEAPTAEGETVVHIREV